MSSGTRCHRQQNSLVLYFSSLTARLTEIGLLATLQAPHTSAACFSSPPAVRPGDGADAFISLHYQVHIFLLPLPSLPFPFFSFKKVNRIFIQKSPLSVLVTECEHPSRDYCFKYFLEATERHRKTILSPEMLILLIIIIDCVLNFSIVTLVDALLQ